MRTHRLLLAAGHVLLATGLCFTAPLTGAQSAPLPSASPPSRTSPSRSDAAPPPDGARLTFDPAVVPISTDVRLSIRDAAISFQPTETNANTADKPAPAGDNSEDLAKKLSNPVADLISVPFQFNYDAGFGPKDAGQYLLNIQPVIPFSISDEWNLITRTIVPVVARESPADGIDDRFGLGDTVQSFFFSPKEGDVTWGVGPVFLWPSATSNDLGSRKFGVGPTAVILKQDSGWTYGLLGNHLWSFAGEEDRQSVNATFLQPFVSYTFPTQTTLTLNSESTYDWTNEQWTVPINLIGAQLLKIGDQPVQFSIGGRYYAESPDGGPEWGLRFAFTLLFPK